jgi:hypothetical protein
MRDSELGINLTVIALLLMLTVGIAFVSACVLAWAWNLVVPLLWHAAPHLTWLHTLAIWFVLSLVRGIITVNVHKAK